MSWPEAFAVVGGCIAVAAILLGLFWMLAQTEAPPTRRPVVLSDLPYTYHYRGPANSAPKWMSGSGKDIEKIIAEELAKARAERAEALDEREVVG